MLASHTRSNSCVPLSKIGRDWYGMLTYQLQQRYFARKSGGPMVFPGDAEIVFQLGPPEAFGSSTGPSRTLMKDGIASLYFNANAGRTLGETKPALAPLDVTVELATARFEFRGDKLLAYTRCEGARQLEGFLRAVHHLLPPLLALEYPDPPVILSTSGRIGETEFEWLLRQFIGHLLITTQEDVERHAALAAQRLLLFEGRLNRRVCAALHYHYVATRLLVVGNSDWEFMSEAILNYCKALEVLFGPQRDDVRHGLRNLGFGSEEIEQDFMPFFVLRSRFDVAHPRTAILKSSRLGVLYDYLENSRSCYQEALRRVLAGTEDGSLDSPSEDLELDSAEQKELDGLIDSMQARLSRLASRRKRAS